MTDILDEWVTDFRDDLGRFRRWANDPRLTGLRERMVLTDQTAMIFCDDRHDLDHVLLLLVATGVNVDPEVKGVDHVQHRAKFGDHVTLYVRCPR